MASVRQLSGQRRDANEIGALRPGQIGPAGVFNQDDESPG
jgi:hypothetical protein